MAYAVRELFLNFSSSACSPNDLGQVRNITRPIGKMGIIIAPA